MRLSVLAMRLASELCLKPRKPSQETPPLKEGRRSAERRTTGPHRKAMRRASFLLSSLRRTKAARTSWSGRARLSAPHRGIRGFFGLGSAQAALPGTTGCKREDPLRHQCSEHLAVRHVPDGTMPKPPASAVYRYANENRSRSALRSTLAKGVPLRAGFWVGNCNGDGSQGRCLFMRDTPLGGLAQRNPPSDCREAPDYGANGGSPARLLSATLSDRTG
jgi:hypothetical protein